MLAIVLASRCPVGKQSSTLALFAARNEVMRHSETSQNALKHGKL